VETRLRPFERAVAAGLGPWPEGSVFLAAVSGGADSTAMLAALEVLSREGKFRLNCLHVEHGIRPAGESRGDAEAVRALCGTLKVPCRVVSVPPGKIAETARVRGLGIEGTARLFRRAAWNREARRLGAELVLVGHTRDDLLETLLMRILRGSGPGGLAAMPRRRGRILRPLLALGRAEVLGYLRDRGIPWRTDSTNADPVFLRNRVRTKLIPCLDEFFPPWKQSLMAMAETQRLTADFLAAEAAIRVPWTPLPLSSGPAAAEKTAWRTPASAFFAAPELIREEALFAALDRLGADPEGPPAAPSPGDAPDGHREAPDGIPRREAAPPRRRSLRLFTQGEAPALNLGALRVERRGDWVVLSPQAPPGGGRGFSLVVGAPGLYTLGKLRFEIRPLTGAGTAGGGPPGEDGFFAELPLVLRDPRPSDGVERGGRRVSIAKALDRRPGSEYTSIISAEDSRGIAAFIGLRRGKAVVLSPREEPRGEQAESPLSFFVFFGGIYVQRSE
jgi:tRNA(Ile)-lysidine synthase